MRFRLGLMVGGAVGYVLGARAGRQRYEDIRRWAGAVRKNPAVEQITHVGASMVTVGRKMAAGGLEKTSEAIRKRA
ncbi:MAG: YtxH domain-containing protein [Actinomycetota bacterium]